MYKTDMETASVNDEQRPLLGGPKHDDHGSISHDAENAVAEEYEATTWECLKVMSSVWLNMFLAALDCTIVATLSAAISSSFDSLTLLSWIASGYLIACAAIQPLSGKLTDIYGRKEGLLVANVFFFTGNLICALADSSLVMIAGRVIAGIGGGCLIAISLFITSDLVPLRRRGVWQGITNIFYGVSWLSHHHHHPTNLSRSEWPWEASSEAG
jgi:hypothetical protein